ncbi:methyltransferase domain-containing protein [Aestuariibacter sp. GS-14]|uniref:methyltransferase domain-containing protein n=1 Tax=Aestuariibacter sp. GS-14 TaxID=2590670 RepID=UPI0011268BCE|nr:methyltransferase domain-containing protein [Aestuariibacter sp. GS-14]TPV55134.1 methyltransferase domain-containing protein [Aestuariibacter sp. GS-14]
MHWQAYQFVSAIRTCFPSHFRNKSVLEIGSHSVNGSIRDLFDTEDYTGLDLSEGEGVDEVISGHLYSSDKRFDVVISCECFEHNPYFVETFENMINHLAEDGLLIFTCATTGRPEHGTSRTDPSMSPGTSSLNWDYYRNLTEADFKGFGKELSGSLFFTNEYSQDLYFIGVRSDSLVKQLNKSTPDLNSSINAYREISRDKMTVFSQFTSIKNNLFCPDFIFYTYNQLKTCGIVQNEIFSRSVRQSYIYWPNNAKVNFVLAKILDNEENLDAAYLYRKAYLYANGNAFFSNAYADFLAGIYDYKNALKVLMEIPHVVEQTGLVIKVVNLQVKLGEFSRSLEFIERALDVQQNNPLLLNSKLNIYQKSGADRNLIRSLADKILLESNPPEWVESRCRSVLMGLGS